MYCHLIRHCAKMYRKGTTEMSEQWELNLSQSNHTILIQSNRSYLTTSFLPSDALVKEKKLFHGPIREEKFYLRSVAKSKEGFGPIREGNICLKGISISLANWERKEAFVFCCPPMKVIPVESCAGSVKNVHQWEWFNESHLRHALMHVQTRWHHHYVGFYG